MPSPDESASRLGASLHHGLALLGFLGLTLLYLRPVARVLGTHMTPEPLDPLLSVYSLKWGIHQIQSGMSGYLNAPFFFPATHTITYADCLLGTAAFTALLAAVVPNAVAVYNLFLVGSFVLCGFNTWFVLRRCGVGAPAAFFAGCAFAFSAFRWDQLNHLPVLLMQWIPLLLWSFDRLLALPGWRRAGLFLAFYALHMSGGVYLAYMAQFPLLVLLLSRVPELWRQRSRRAVAVLLTSGALALGVAGAAFLPYLLGARNPPRPESEIQAYGASLVSFVTPAELNFYSGSWNADWRRRENALFAGLLPTLFVLAGAVAAWKRLHQPPRSTLSVGRRAAVYLLAGLGAAGYLLGEVVTWAAFTGHPDLGSPVLYPLAAGLLVAGLAALLLRRRWGGNWGIDLAALDPWERGLLFSGLFCWLLAHMIVYQPLMAVVPGLANMRVPARLYPFISFPLVWFAARGLDGWLQRAEPAGRRRAIAVAATAFLLVELAPRQVPWGPVPGEAAFPSVYHWLAGRADVRAVLELPMRDSATEVTYMYFGTLHWKPLVNGYSGHFAGAYVDLRRTCCHPVPDDADLERLRLWGVSHVLVHLGALRPDDRPTVLAWGGRDGIHLDYAEGADLVFRIAPPS